jgi:NADH-quinone oxidoreductase subunit G
LREFKNNEIGIIGSAFASCEDNFSLVKFAKSLGVSNIDFTKHVRAGDHDEILIREDKSPNSLGAELVGIKPLNNGYALNGILQAIQQGKIKVLLVMEDDIASLNDLWNDALKSINLLIVFATNLNQTANLAHVLFPASTYAEKNGTFVNFQGRIQRIKAAVATEELDRTLDGMNLSRWDKFGTKFDRWLQGKKIDAKPSWKIISIISQSLNGKLKYDTVEDVFADMSNQIEVFKGLDYDVVGDSGIQIKIKQTVLA